MRNLETTISEGEIEDELGALIADEDTDSIGALVSRNIWGDEELTGGVFVEIAFSTGTQRYSSFDVDLFYDSNFYIANELRVNGLSFESDLSVDQAAIQLQNVNLTMSAILFNTDEIFSKVTVSVGALASTRVIYDLFTIFYGEVTGWTITEQSVVFRCSGLMSRWSKKTLRIAQGSCPWPIGGDECQYAGSENCSQTLSRCRDFDNQINFGGFVYLPALQEKKIYWGYPKP